MAELQLIVDNTALEAVHNLQLKANFDDVESALAELIEPYKNMVVMEEDIPQAKTDRAKIRKVSNSIDEHRKMVKKMYSEPLKVFEENCKRLTAVCEQGITNLDTQIKKYENQAKAKKLNGLEAYFDSIEKKYPEYCSFSECENPKWTNLTYPVEDAQREIENYIQCIETDIDAIKALDSKYELTLLDEYKRKGNVSAALMLKQRLEESERQAEEKRQKALEAELTKRREAEAAIQKDLDENGKIQLNAPSSEQEQPKEKPFAPQLYSVTCWSERVLRELTALKNLYGDEITLERRI